MELMQLRTGAFGAERSNQMMVVIAFGLPLCQCHYPLELPFLPELLAFPLPLLLTTVRWLCFLIG